MLRKSVKTKNTKAEGRLKFKLIDINNFIFNATEGSKTSQITNKSPPPFHINKRSICISISTKNSKLK